MMITSVSDHTDVYMPSTAATPSQSTAKSVPAEQDSVHLSPQAQAAASGDVDHDGDSH